MFSRGNLFKYVDCPFDPNDCNRPYCPFRHPNEIASGITVESDDAYIPENFYSNQTEIQVDSDPHIYGCSSNPKSNSNHDPKVRIEYPNVGLQNDEMTVLGNSIYNHDPYDDRKTSKNEKSNLNNDTDLKETLKKQQREIDKISEHIFDRRCRRAPNVYELAEKLENISETMKKIQKQLAKNSPEKSKTLNYTPTPLHELEERKNSTEWEPLPKSSTNRNPDFKEIYENRKTSKTPDLNSMLEDLLTVPPVEPSVKFKAEKRKSEVLYKKSESKRPKLEQKVEKVLEKSPVEKKTTKLVEFDMFSMEQDQQDKPNSTLENSIENLNQPKKRIAHASSSEISEKYTKLNRKPALNSEMIKPVVITPHQQLRIRYEQLEKQKEEMLRKNAESSTSKLKNQKQKIDITMSSGKTPQIKTVGCTLEKGGTRTAHLTSISAEKSKRPVLPIDIGSKVPTSIRQRYLNLFIDECLKVCTSEEEAYDLGLEQENLAFQKSQSKTSYLNAAVIGVKRLREVTGNAPAFQTTPEKAILSHSDVLCGKIKGSITLRRSAGLKDQTELNFYECMSKYILTEQQMDDHGYAKFDQFNPEVVIFCKEDWMKNFVDDEDPKRTCSRCSCRFQLVFDEEVDDYEYLGSTDCIHHWGRAWKRRVCGTVEPRYTCCQGDSNSRGCCLAKFHVAEVLPKSFLLDFKQTQPKNGAELNVFALDCEMIYTTFGPALARVTVVDEKKNVVYDKIVRPKHTILDCNTKFSGLKEEMLLQSTSVPFEQCRKELLQLFHSETILLGHGLEGDLKFLKIIHKKVVDTTVVFPHHRGLPFKRALKTLVLENLQKIIQDDVEGHDSKEDAVSCLELMHWKIKQDRPALKRC